MATDQEARDAGFILPADNDLIRDGDDALTNNAKKTVDLFKKSKTKKPLVIEYLGISITPATLFDNLEDAEYVTRFGATSLDLGCPEEIPGEIIKRTWGSTSGLIRFTTREIYPKVYEIARLSGGWSGWHRVDAGAVEFPEYSAATTGARSSGTKTIPLALTLGHGGGVTSPASGTVVIPTDWNAPILRWRIAVRDGNPRFGVVKSNATTFTNIKANGVVQISSVSMPAGTDVFYFPWVPGNPNQDIEYTYSASVAPYGQVGGGTIGGVAQSYLPFEMWVEVEVPSSVPVIAVGGDSNACGVRTTQPIHDSWLSQYCRRIAALPVHYAASGDSYQGWADPDQWKWNRWDHLDKPDVFIDAWGSNDAAQPGANIASVMAFAEDVWAIVAGKVSPNQHVITVKPRNGGDANYNTVRRAYNTRVQALPSGLRDWHDMVTPVSSDDTVMLPGMYAPDGTHMSTAGHKALADSISKTVSFPGGIKFSENVGRVATAWDPINQREQLIYGDTGVRNVSSLIQEPWIFGGGGTIRLVRTGNTVNVIVNGVRNTAPETGYSDIAILPMGFRPNEWLYSRSFRDAVCALSTGGQLSIKTPGSSLEYFYFTFITTNEWPDTLPGIPA